MDRTLQGKTALITGGGTGIGREIALELARHGASIAVVGRREEPLRAVASEAGQFDVRGMPVRADVRDENSVDQLVERVEREWGHVDIVVNNAATFARGSVAELEVERFKDVIATNLTGAFLVTRRVLPGMIRRQTGDIVFISSTAGKRADAGGSAYAASKHGIMGFAHSLLYETRKHNIRVIVVSPSAIDTRAEVPDPADVQGKQPHASDVAASVVHCLTLPGRSMIREVEIWGTNP